MEVEKPIHVPDALITALEERFPNVPLSNQRNWTEREIWFYGGQRAAIDVLRFWKQESEKSDVSAES